MVSEPMQMALPFLLIAAGSGYLLGSIPFGLLITHAAGLGDIRRIGSGNIGATNVLRTGNKGLAALTLLFDALKGAVAVLIAAPWGNEFAMAAGFGALLGHIFSVWLGFKGGKGVATYVGVLTALVWIAVPVFALVWLATAILSRYSSLAAILAAIAVPVALFFLGHEKAAGLFAVMSFIVIVKHHGNIARLIAGSEPRIGSRG